MPLRVRVRLGERPGRDVVDVAPRFANDIRFEEDPVLGGLRHERSIGLRPFAAFDVPEHVRVSLGESRQATSSSTSRGGSATTSASRRTPSSAACDTSA